MAGLSQLVHFLRRIVVPPESVGDAVFLDRFTHGGDEDAFASLVARHGPMVWRVCNSVLVDKTSVDDCFQATFLVLARKARVLKRSVALPGWLHGVALRVASEARRRARRHALLPLPAGVCEAADSSPDPLESLTARELLVAVREEVQGLPESYRLPIILCCLENLSHAEAAQRLGCTAGSIKGRLERGRARLSMRLAKRGLSPSGALLAASLPIGTALGGVRPGLGGATIKAAMLYAAHTVARPYVGSRAALGLADAVLGSIAASPGKVIAVVAIILAAAVGAGGISFLKGIESSLASCAGEQRDTAQTLPEQTERKKDIHGDLLPAGAVARLGTLRQRAPGSQLAVTADGKEIVTVDNLLTVRRFDSATGDLRHESQLPVGNRASLARLSPHGTYALVAVHPVGGSKLELWHLATAERLRPLTFPKDVLLPHESELAFSPDERFVGLTDSTSTSARHRVVLWDMKTFESWVLASTEFREQERYAQPIVAFSADSKRLAVCHFDRFLRCFDVLSRERLWEFKTGYGLQTLFFTPDGKAVVSSPRRWDSATGKIEETKQRPPKDAFYPLGFSPDGQFMVYEDGLEGMVLWRSGAAATSCRFPAPEPRVRTGLWIPGKPPLNFAFMPDGKSVVRLQGTLQGWDIESGKPTFPITESWGHTSAVTNLRFSPDGRLLASCSNDETVRLWDLATKRVLHIVGRGRGDCLAFAPDGKILLTMASLMTNQGHVRQWDVNTGQFVRDLKQPEPKQTLITHYTKDTDLRFTADGKKALHLYWTEESMESICSVWNVTDGARVDHKAVSKSRRCVFTPDGKGVLTPDSLLDLESGKIRWVFQSDSVQDPDKQTFEWGLVVSPNGSLMAVQAHFRVAGADVYDNVRVADMATGRQLFKVAASMLAGLEFSGDGGILAMVTNDNVRLFETATWQEVGSLKMQTGLSTNGIQAATFSPDGRTLANGHRDSTILLWDLTFGAGPTARDLTAAQATSLWDDLAAQDARRAYAAVWRLADAKGQAAMTIITQNLKPIVERDFEKARAHISDLASATFKVREKARKELENLGSTAAPVILEALDLNPPLEVRRRLEVLLSRPMPLTAATLRDLRAVHVLERMATTKARGLLSQIAGGMRHARQTQEAKAALERLSRLDKR
jgi:RNA polymerase sigma factor (sigma-70 family)